MDADFYCRSGKHCVAHTSDNPAVVSKYDALCARCIDAIQEQLDQLPHLVEILRLSLGGSMKVAYQSKVAKTSEPQAPMNLHVDAILGDIENVVQRTDGLAIRDLVNRPPEAAEIWVKGKPRKVFLDGISRALDVRRVHKRAEDMTGLSVKWERRFAPCPECGSYSLGSWSGSDKIECTEEDCQFAGAQAEYAAYCFIESKKK